MNQLQQQCEEMICCCCVPRIRKKKKGVSQQEPLVPVKECIARMRCAVGIENLDSGDETHITITGRQCYMDMEGEYRFLSCSDGRFYEQFKGEHITVEWAHDGKNTWYADFAGRVTKLELDSLELCLLTAWIRTGYWLTEEGQSKLLIEHGSEVSDPLIVKQPRIQVLNVKIKDFNKVVAYVIVDTETWLPLRMIARVSAGIDSWGYSDWQMLQPACQCRIPFSIAHLPASGGIDSVSITSCNVQRGPSIEQDNAIFAMPSSRVIPRDNIYPSVQFDDTISPHVNLVQAESGHYLVRPLIDHQDIGYFIVDTGASGLSIAADQARKLCMGAFGEVYLLGVENRVKSRFALGKEFQVGGLKILNPLYIEVSIGTMARGVAPVVGVCGFDLFFHCIVEMSMAKGFMSLFNPSTYTSSHYLQWQSMYLLNNVPHVSAKINGQEAVLLLDTGAGGADVILHARAAREFGLVTDEERLQYGNVKGLDGLSAGGLQAGGKELQSLEVGGLLFEKPKCLLLPQQVGNIDFSVYTAGLLCGHLLRTSLIVIDYQKSRFALVKSESVD